MPELVTLDEIRLLLDTNSLIDEIEAGFVLYSDGKVNVPPVGFMHFDDPPGDVHIKYGSIQDDDYWVLKVASGFYQNPSLGLQSSDGVILVFSQRSGALELVLHDRCWLTDMRTAAAGAVAARHLAPRKIDNVGVIGTGVQARMQLEMLCSVVEAKSALIWGRNEAKVGKMIGELKLSAALLAAGMEVRAAESVEELADQSRLIVTATSAHEPVLRADQVRPGTHITAMGSDDDGKQELDVALLGKADRIVADSVSQCSKYGECVHAINAGVISLDDIAELGAVVSGSTDGRTSDDQITIADLTGVAVQDIQIAKMIARAL
ncbi:MAG TPA: ornithine cyclodeaminase family protein [Gemmatimonadetes bacterium]|nr:ornithine cyclodeaminase family protein [Gemmatimonadota bacterium]HCW78733.1 ornithine cyclodeaminase family protein [Gemmatimonadota bacterium]|tara:strand:- start:3186 stop:4148 length:963 start_codon:yes stop_codon:yes gene_type:complete